MTQTTDFAIRSVIYDATSHGLKALADALYDAYLIYEDANGECDVDDFMYEYSDLIDEAIKMTCDILNGNVPKWHKECVLDA